MMAYESLAKFVRRKVSYKTNLRFIYACASLHLGVCMPKRTSVMLDEEIYEALVREGLKRYGTSKALSKVLNELLKEALKGEKDLLQLIYSEKVVKTTVKEFEDFRREISRRLEA